MTQWNLSVYATLDRAPTDHEALRLGREIAGDDIAMVANHDDRFGVTATAETVDPRDALGALGDQFADVLADNGYTLVRWEALEVLSLDETERRIATSSVPPMVSAVELAEMCGVTKQRIYELEHERRKAADEGQAHPFPTPVVPGWWLKSAAERYAATRKRKPGPARRDE